MPQEHQKVIIDYTNWRGKRKKRTILPLDLMFSESQWHPDGAQWFLLAVDDNSGQSRHFALKDIHSWETAPKETKRA